MLRHRTTAFVCACLVAVSAACGDGATGARRRSRRRPSRPDARVRALADAYLEGYFRAESRPGDAVRRARPPPRRAARQLARRAAGPGRPRKTAGSPRRSRSIPPPSRRRRCAAPTPSSARRWRRRSASRVCRNELWTVSQFVNGWQVQDGYTVTIQPVGTDEARKEALARWSRLPKYVDTEIANLREGLKAGYSAPKGNVRIVIDQMNTLIATPTADSPFDSPSVRDKTPEFMKQFDLLVREQIVPAFKRYRDFLREGIPAGGARGDRACRPTRTARPATTRRSATTARCRSRRARCTRPACARSSGSTRR